MPNFRVVGYRHNVLKDLNFKAGKVKNAKFLLVSGELVFTAAGLAASLPPALSHHPPA